jgi:hypothetical protein
VTPVAALAAEVCNTMPGSTNAVSADKAWPHAWLNTTYYSWPLEFNHTHDNAPAKWQENFAKYQKLFEPTEKVNTHENVYHHMLQLRTLQPRGAHGHIGFFPIQTFKYWWLARQLTNRFRIANLGWPNVCEVGFGTGMSTAMLATATSSPTSSLVGGNHFIFDCRYCAGIAGGKTPSMRYLKAVFGRRLRLVEGPSSATMKKFAAKNPSQSCDFFSIDGAHTYPQVLHDIRAARPLAHKDTILLFDDYQLVMVNRSLTEAIAEGLIYIRQVFNAEQPLDADPIFSANRAHLGTAEVHDPRKTKRFVLAGFVTQRASPGAARASGALEDASVEEVPPTIPLVS